MSDKVNIIHRISLLRLSGGRNIYLSAVVLLGVYVVLYCPLSLRFRFCKKLAFKTSFLAYRQSRVL